MSISTGIGEVNNKVISQALRISVSGLQRLNPRGFILVNYDRVPWAVAQAKGLDIQPWSWLLSVLCQWGLAEDVGLLYNRFGDGGKKMQAAENAAQNGCSGPYSCSFGTINTLLKYHPHTDTIKFECKGNTLKSAFLLRLLFRHLRQISA